jgi:hypothetical protein
LGYKYADPFCLLRENANATIVPRACDYATISAGGACQLQVDITSDTFPDTTFVLSVSQNPSYVYRLPSISVVMTSEFLQTFMDPQPCSVPTDCGAGMQCFNFRSEVFTAPIGEMPRDPYGMLLWGSDYLLLSNCRSENSWICEFRALVHDYIDEAHKSYPVPACPAAWCVYNFSLWNFTDVTTDLSYGAFTPISLTDVNLHFGSQSVPAGPGSPLIANVANNGPLPVTFSAGSCTTGDRSSFFISADTNQAGLNPGETRSIQFKFAPQSNDTFAATWCFNVDDGFTTRLWSVNVDGVGTCSSLPCTPPPTAVYTTPSGAFAPSISLFTLILTALLVFFVF